MRKWPPFVWPLMSLASLLILIGGSGHLAAGWMVAGWALALLGMFVAVYLALRRWPGRPRPRGVYRAMGGVAAFYLLLALAAATAGPAYAVAGLAAGVFPLTALALIVATARAKTGDSDGRLWDESAESAEDPHPGIGLDDQTPLGDSSQHADHAA